MKWDSIQLWYFHLNNSEQGLNTWIYTLKALKSTRQIQCYHCTDQTPLIVQDFLKTGSKVLILSLNSSPVQEVSLSGNTWRLLSCLPLFTLNLTNSTDYGRSLSVRRGNPLGVLWVICWCGTWAVKHPGALQERRVTVMLSRFTLASAWANRPALPLRRLHVETITEQTALQLCLLWYLIRFVCLLFHLSAF